MNWYIDVIKNYAVFSGRARRKEYWMFMLFNLLISFALGFIEGFLGGPGILSLIYTLAILIPSLAVTVRRLHDTGRSGWWVLISIVPILGIILLIFMLLDSQPNENEYGQNPKAIAA